MSFKRCTTFAQIEEIDIRTELLHGEDNLSRSHCAVIASIFTWQNSNCPLTVYDFLFYVNNTSGK